MNEHPEHVQQNMVITLHVHAFEGPAPSKNGTELF